VIFKSKFILIVDSSITSNRNLSVNRIIINICNYIKRKIIIIKINPYLIIIIIKLKRTRTLRIFKYLKIKIFRLFFNLNLDFYLLAVKKIVKKNARPYEIYYDNEKSRSEVENVIEINEDIADENPSEVNEYYADKIGKHYRNYNLIFELENKLY
jgi:hypothetical protein